MRVDYGFTPLMFVSALAQYSSADRAVSTNVRYRWEYAPGSELFLVYTDEHGTDDPLAPSTLGRGLRNRAFVVKVNRLLLNNIDVRGVGWGAYAMARPGYMRWQWDQLVPMMQSGVIAPPIGATYAFEEMGRALDDLAERRTLGKSVVVV